MIIGMLFVFLTNEWITQASLELGPTTVGNVDHIYNYADNIRLQSNELVEKYANIENSTNQELKNLGAVLGEPVQSELQTQFDPVFTKLRLFESHMLDVLKNIETTSQNVVKLKNKTQVFAQDLTELRRNMLSDLNFDSCWSNQHCLELIKLTELMEVTANFSGMSLMNEEIEELQLVIGESNMTKIIDDGQDAIDSIEQLIDNLSQNDIDILLDSNHTFDAIYNTFQSTIEHVFDLIDLQTNESIPLNDFRQAVEDFSDNKAEDLDHIRYQLGLTVGSFLAIILGFNVLGILLGFCGYKREATPTNRTGVSNLGGISLMLSVGASFGLGWILMVITSGVFALGGHTERYMCQTMQEDPNSGNFTGLQFLYELGASMGYNYPGDLLRPVNRSIENSSFIIDPNEYFRYCLKQIEHATIKFALVSARITVECIKCLTWTISLTWTKC